MIWILIILGILLLLAGSPLAYVIGAAGVMAFVVSEKVSYLAVLPQRIFSQLDLFALMAMALFIMTGEIMTRLRVTKALVDFSICLVGRFKGGLGHVNVLTNIFFAGVSGSAVADAAALSNTLVPRHAGAGLPQALRGRHHGGRFRHRSHHPSEHHPRLLTAPSCRFRSPPC